MRTDPLAAVPAPFRLDWHPVLDEIRAALKAVTIPAYLVGGAVRDALLRRPINDLDFVTLGNGQIPAKRLADYFGGAYYPLDAERGVGRAIVEYQGQKFSLDVAQARGATLLDDLTARDFTVNALAVALNGDMQALIDPLNGLLDIQRKIMRRCSPDSIQSDPIRALRGLRQSVQFKFLIDPQTRQDMRTYGVNLVNTSMERVRDEFVSLLDGPRPHVGLRALDMLGLLRLIVPEVDAMRGVPQSAPHVFDVWEHTLNVVEQLDGVLHTISLQRTPESAGNTADGMIVYMLDMFRRALLDHLDTPLPNERSVRALLMLAALLHDAGKPLALTTREDGAHHFYDHEIRGEAIAIERGMALKLSNEEIERLAAIARNHMRPMHLHMHVASGGQITRRSVYRYWKAAGTTVGVDVCLLTLADYLGMVGSHLDLQNWIMHIQGVAALLDGLYHHRAEVVAPPPLLTGKDVMEVFHLKPGPHIGRILRALQEAQASGEIATREQALELARHVVDRPDSDDSPEDET